MTVTQAAVRRWQLTLVAVGLLCVLGLNAFLNIPRAVDPNYPIPTVVVVAVQPGADAADVEQTIAKPLEDVLQGLDDVRTISSRSVDGAAYLTVEFDWSADADARYDDVVREVNAYRAQLPGGVQRVEFRKVRMTNSAVVQLALVSAGASTRRLEKVGEDLRDRLNQAPGVRQTRLYGLQRPEVQVALDLGRMDQLGVTPDQVTTALRLNGADLPAGAVHAGELRLNVKAGGAFRSLAEVDNTVVAAAGERLVRVRDIARTAWGTAEPQHITRYNGQRAVFVTAMPKEGASVLEVRSAIADALERFDAQLPPDMRIEIGFDQSRDIRDKLGRLRTDFLIAVGLVLITLAPLGLRAGAVVVVTIPLCLAAALIALQGLGYTLNQLTIAGFILSLGLLVDDSIVVTENIARRMRNGEPPGIAAVEGARQIAAPVIGCTAVLLFAFLPLLFLPDSAGSYTRSLPLTVVLTVAASLAVSLTITPFLASRLLGGGGASDGNVLLRLIDRGVERLYAPVLRWTLSRPKRTVAGALVLCFGALALVPVLGFRLFPPADVPYFNVTVEAPAGASLKTVDEAVRHVSTVVRNEPGVRTTLENVGRGNPQVFYNVREDSERTNFGAVLVVLDRWDADAGPALLDRLRRTFANYPAARIVVRPFDNGVPVDAPIAVRISGPDFAELKRLAGGIERLLQNRGGVRDVYNPVAIDRTDLALGLDADKAAALGVSPGQARRTVRLALSGETAGRFRDGEGDAYDVVVRLPLAERHEVEVLGSIRVPSTNGGAVPLRQVATPAFERVPPQIDRYNLQRTVTVTAQTASDVLASDIVESLRNDLAGLKLPPGYALTFGGEAEASERSTGGLGGVALVALFGVIGVLVVEFGRFREMLVVAGVIPLGLFGGLVALWLTGNPLSYLAVIGFIALIGIEIKNSILLVDFASKLTRAGLPPQEAVERAGAVRFMPVLLTSVTAVGGLLPLALSGISLYTALAWVIIGGLVSSTLLSRVVTPAMYLLLIRGEAGTEPSDRRVEQALRAAE